MTELGFQPAVKRSLPYLPHLQDRWPYRFGAAASGSHVLVVLYIEIIDADAALALKVFVKDISELAALGVPDYEFLKGKTVHGIVAGRSVRWLVPSKVKYIKETCASCGCGVWLSSGCFLEGTLPAACGSKQDLLLKATSVSD